MMPAQCFVLSEEFHNRFVSQPFKMFLEDGP